MTTSGPAVSVSGIGKRYRLTRDRRTTIKERIVRGRARHVEEFWALRDVSLSIPRGSVYGLVGHNGSGKSTLLKLIGRIQRPTEGSIEVDGRVAALIELGAGFHPDMTGRENIRLNGSILGLSRREVDAATAEIVDFSGLGAFVDEPVKTYSSGMYVRLGFSVAVHMRPDVLLIDEVLAVGDEDFQRRCFDHLYDLRRSGRTIVVVSHALALVESLCDEVAWLDHGHLKAAGVPGTVVTSYVESVHEAAASSGREVGPGGAAPHDRPGSGELRIVGASLADEDGMEVDAAVQGSPMRLVLHVSTRQPIDSPVVALSFRHESGAVVTAPTTQHGPRPLPTVSGNLQVHYVQDPCRLSPGHYSVDVVVYDKSGTKVFDRWGNAMELAVRPSGRPEPGGLVALPGAFELVSHTPGPGMTVGRREPE